MNKCSFCGGTNLTEQGFCLSCGTQNTLMNEMTEGYQNQNSGYEQVNYQNNYQNNCQNNYQNPNNYAGYGGANNYNSYNNSYEEKREYDKVLEAIDREISIKEKAKRAKQKKVSKFLIPIFIFVIVLVMAVPILGIVMQTVEEKQQIAYEESILNEISKPMNAETKTKPEGMDEEKFVPYVDVFGNSGGLSESENYYKIEMPVYQVDEETYEDVLVGKTFIYIDKNNIYNKKSFDEEVKNVSLEAEEIGLNLLVHGITYSIYNDENRDEIIADYFSYEDNIKKAKEFAYEKNSTNDNEVIDVRLLVCSEEDREITRYHYVIENPYCNYLIVLEYTDYMHYENEYQENKEQVKKLVKDNLKEPVYIEFVPVD